MGKMRSIRRELNLTQLLFFEVQEISHFALASIEDSMFQFNSIVLLSSIEVLIEIYLRTCRDEIRDLLSSCFQFEFEDHCSFAMS